MDGVAGKTSSKWNPDRFPEKIVRWNTGGSTAEGRVEAVGQNKMNIKERWREERDVWQGWQLSFIKSIGYESRSVSLGDVVGFFFLTTQTHTNVQNELWVEAALTQCGKAKYLRLSIVAHQIKYSQFDMHLYFLTRWLTEDFHTNWKVKTSKYQQYMLTFSATTHFPLTTSWKDFNAAKQHVLLVRFCQ